MLGKLTKLEWLLALAVLAFWLLPNGCVTKNALKPTARSLPTQKGLASMTPMKSQMRESQPVVVPPPRTNILKFRYATNAVAVFGWEIQTSSDMKTWDTLIYPVMDDVPTVLATNVKAFFRVKAHN
jgi:hypothetical protein